MIHYLLIHLLSLLFLLGITDQIWSSYTKPAGFPEEVWDELKPYFLDECSPLRVGLDKVLPSSVTLSSIEALKKHGFQGVKKRHGGLIVASHPDLRGYLFKIYLHGFPAPEWPLFLNRIRGAELIAKIIKKHGLGFYLKVPHKWIYPLQPAEVHRSIPKHFVLVVEDMKTLSTDGNLESYRHIMDKRRLQALYLTLREGHLFDSVYPDNVPFCTDGRVAFVDTEHYLKTDRPMRYERLGRFLSKPLRRYWLKLTSSDVIPKNTYD